MAPQRGQGTKKRRRSEALVLALDPAAPGHRRRRDQERLAPPAGGAGAGLGQRDRVVLALHVARVGVDLVEEQEAGGHGAQAHRAVGAGEHQDAAGELLREQRIAAAEKARFDAMVAELQRMSTDNFGADP
jgi:hypothetical protein